MLSVTLIYIHKLKRNRLLLLVE